MSENLDLVRSICAAWERGDFASAEWADDKIEFVLPDGPDPGSWTGIAAMGEAWGRRISAAESFRIEAEEFRELDYERVLVLTPVSGRSKTTGLDLAQMSRKGATLFHISNGKVTRLVPYFDRDRALADLGLEEWAVSEQSTTPDPVERTRQRLEETSRGEWDLEGFIDSYATDAVLDTAGYGMGTFEGREAIRGFLGEWIGSFDDLTMEADEIVGFGDAVVLTVYRQRGRPRGASNYVRVRSAWLAEFVGDMIVRVTVYTEAEIDEARAAAERLAQERE